MGFSGIYAGLKKYKQIFGQKFGFAKSSPKEKFSLMKMALTDEG